MVPFCFKHLQINLTLCRISDCDSRLIIFAALLLVVFFGFAVAFSSLAVGCWYVGKPPLLGRWMGSWYQNAPRIGLGTTDRNFVTIPGSFLVRISANWMSQNPCGKSTRKNVQRRFHQVCKWALRFHRFKVLFFLLIDGYSIDIEWFRPGKDILWISPKSMQLMEEIPNNHLGCIEPCQNVISTISTG